MKKTTDMNWLSVDGPVMGNFPRLKEHYLCKHKVWVCVCGGGNFLVAMEPVLELAL